MMTTGPAAIDFDALVPIAATSDGRFRVGAGGVRAVATTADRKVEFVDIGGHLLAHVRSAMGYPAYYPVHPAAH